MLKTGIKLAKFSLIRQYLLWF